MWFNDIVGCTLYNQSILGAGVGSRYFWCPLSYSLSPALISATDIVGGSKKGRLKLPVPPTGNTGVSPLSSRTFPGAEHNSAWRQGQPQNAEALTAQVTTSPGGYRNGCINALVSYLSTEGIWEQNWAPVACSIGLHNTLSHWLFLSPDTPYSLTPAS